MGAIAIMVLLAASVFEGSTLWGPLFGVPDSGRKHGREAEEIEARILSWSQAWEDALSDPEAYFAFYTQDTTLQLSISGRDTTLTGVEQIRDWKMSRWSDIDRMRTEVLEVREVDVHGNTATTVHTQRFEGWGPGYRTGYYCSTDQKRLTWIRHGGSWAIVEEITIASEERR